MKQISIYAYSKSYEDGKEPMLSGFFTDPQTELISNLITTIIKTDKINRIQICKDEK